MAKIRITGTGQEFEYATGATLLECLLSQGIFVDNPCAGRGVCGKCKVRIFSGDAGEITSTEDALLKPEEKNCGIRLSCMVVPNGDVEIGLLKKEGEHKVLSAGYMPQFEKAPDIRKMPVRVHKPLLTDQTPFEDQIIQQTGAGPLSYRLLKESSFSEGCLTAVVFERPDGHVEIIDLIKDDADNVRLYGAAIDIGTTTVVMTLVDMETGEELATSSMINAQKHFGLDVLTRITYEIEHPGTGAEKLQQAIVDSINDMLADVCQRAGISEDRVYELTVGANCTMMHMLLGVDAAAIGKSPYAPLFAGARDIGASEAGIRAADGARLYCLPSVSAYIGADIVAGTYVCGLQKADDNVLFIDIGTNGEIVFSDHGKLLCCSCAAGPALEGMNISSGMRAAEGAIEDIVIEKDGANLKVIGDKAPLGLCGSGILAAVKELLRTGLVKKDGAFIKPDKLQEDDCRKNMIEQDGRKRQYAITHEIKITQSDVRQVQLAKGAILSGFYALLRKSQKAMEDLDRVMIAGQFGAHLPADSLVGTGILPDGVKEKLIYVGNSSKTGAYMALMSKVVKREMEELAQHMDYMELGATKDYERLFADCLIFPDIYNDKS